MGRMTSHMKWKIKVMFETTNQYKLWFCGTCSDLRLWTLWRDIIDSDGPTATNLRVAPTSSVDLNTKWLKHTITIA